MPEMKSFALACSNFMLKPDVEPTVIVCLAGRNAKELYTGFV